MLTPEEVASHAFARATFGGYNMMMVDEFLDELTEDYTSLYKENAVLKTKMKILVDKVEEYRATEDSMRSALMTAQQMASSMVTEAKEQQETLLVDAELEARSQLGQLHDEIIYEQKRLSTLRDTIEKFSAEARDIFERELRLLDALPGMTPEEIRDAGTKKAVPQTAAPDITAISEKIVATYDRERAEAAAAEQSNSGTGKAPIIVTASNSQNSAAAARPGIERAAVEPDDNPFVDTATRSIDLSQLKFGRNYNPDQQ